MTRATGGAALDRSDLRIAAAVIVLGVLVQVPALFWGVPGSKAINNAIRILDGEIPYRDFWTMYAPGHFYLVALLFKLFGVNFFVQGAACQLLIALHGGVLFAIVRRVGVERRLAVAAGASLILAQWGSRELSAYEPVLLCGLLALDRSVRYAQGEGARHLVIAGLICGVGAWFKHDVAAYFAIGTAIGLIAAWFLDRARRDAGWISPMGVIVRVGGGAIVAALPVGLWLAIAAGPDAWRDLIVFPATDFAVVRGEGYPAIVPDLTLIGAWLGAPRDLALAQGAGVSVSRWIQATLPYFAFGAGLFMLLWRRGWLSPPAVAVGASALALMPFFWASAHVQHNTNFTSLWVSALTLGAVAWASGRLSRGAARLLAGLFVIGTIGWLMPVVRHVALVAYEWQGHGRLSFPGVAGIRVPRRSLEFQEPINTFIRTHVPETERIYSGLVRHDSVVVSNQSIYFLSGRRVASRYNELHPGVVDREEVQREIIADLERWQVRCVVLWDFGWTKDYMDGILAERRRAMPELGATVLDEHIRNAYEEVGRYGEYVLMWKKGSAR